MASSKPLAAKSEPIDKDQNKVARAMRVRAQDGPYRGGWFRFYFPIDDTLFPMGKTFYLLTQADDPNGWGLREHPDPTI